MGRTIGNVAYMQLCETALWRNIFLKVPCTQFCEIILWRNVFQLTSCLAKLEGLENICGISRALA